MLLVEPNWNTAPVRESMTQVMFESYNTPGLFISKSAVLATFMNAKSTALVLDVGHAWSSAVAVLDGYVLHKCVQRSPVAGQRLTQDLLRYVTSAAAGEAGETPVVHPRYECDRVVDRDGIVKVAIRTFPRTHPSFREYMINDVVRDLKETVCTVSDIDYSDSAYEKVPSTPYQLPDGRVVQLGAQRFKTPELLFKPDLNDVGLGQVGGPVGDKARAVHELVYSAVQMADPDLRRELWGSICLAGGTTMMTGFRERLERDLTNIAPSKVRLTASTFSVERKYSSWIGGSILASLGTFQQVLLTFFLSLFALHSDQACKNRCGYPKQSMMRMVHPFALANVPEDAKLINNKN